MSALYVDTHVHIRACFPRAEVLDAAARSFEKAAGGAEHAGVLMLTESATENAFGELAELAGRVVDTWGYWHVERCPDGISLRCTKQDRTIAIVAGRQIDTSERLEVSALGSDAFIRDGTPVEEVLAQARANDTVQVLPWAPGKWSFARGKLLDDLIARHDELGFALGDNGGRPWAWPMPGPLKRARELGIPVLPGSDPLPFLDEMARSGSFGVRLEGTLEERPGEQIKRLIREGAPMHPYGELNSPLTFFRHELTMQLTKKKRKKIAAARAG